MWMTLSFLQQQRYSWCVDTVRRASDLSNDAADACRYLVATKAQDVVRKKLAGV
jgi:hypothetical protein